MCICPFTHRQVNTAPHRPIPINKIHHNSQGNTITRARRVGRREPYHGDQAHASVDPLDPHTLEQHPLLAGLQ